MKFFLPVALIILGFLGYSLAEKSLVKFEVVSQGIGKLIDFLSANFHMQFTIVTVGKDKWVKDLASKIMKYSTLTVIVKHYNKMERSNLINFDESYLVLCEESDIIPEFIRQSSFSTFHFKITLSFSLDFVDSTVKDILENDRLKYNRTSIPHDFYQLAHSPENGSMWLMSNERFFNKTCNFKYHPINFFNSTMMQWSSTKFFNRNRNFNNCTVFKGTEDIMDTQLSQIKKHNAFCNAILRVFSGKYEINFEEKRAMTTLAYRKFALFEKSNETRGMYESVRKFYRWVMDSF